MKPFSWLFTVLSTSIHDHLAAKYPLFNLWFCDGILHRQRGITPPINLQEVTDFGRRDQ